MNYNVLTVPQFEKDIKKLSKKFKRIKQDLAMLIDSLAEDAKQGTLLSDNLYKIRLANSSTSTGKSGGFRVITYLIDEQNNLYLLAIYSKTEKENISDNEIKEVLKSIE